MSRKCLASVSEGALPPRKEAQLVVPRLAVPDDDDALPKTARTVDRVKTQNAASTCRRRTTRCLRCRARSARRAASAASATAYSHRPLAAEAAAPSPSPSPSPQPSGATAGPA